MRERGWKNIANTTNGYQSTKSYATLAHILLSLSLLFSLLFFLLLSSFLNHFQNLQSIRSIHFFFLFLSAWLGRSQMMDDFLQTASKCFTFFYSCVCERERHRKERERERNVLTLFARNTKKTEGIGIFVRLVSERNSFLVRLLMIHFLAHRLLAVFSPRSPTKADFSIYSSILLIFSLVYCTC